SRAQGWRRQAPPPARPPGNLPPPLVLMGRFGEALYPADIMWAAWQRSRTPIAAWIAPAASAVALAHGLLGNNADCQLWRGRAGRAQGARNPALPYRDASFAAFADIRLMVHTGAVSEPAALIDRALAQSSRGWHEAYALAAAADLAVLADLPDAQERLAAAATAAQENDWAAACIVRAEGRRLGDTSALTESVRRWEHIGARFERDCTLQLLADSARPQDRQNV